MIKRLVLLVTLACGLGFALPAYAADPCLTSNVDKSSVSINISTATTTNVVTLLAGAKTIVCGWVFTANGTAPSFQFISGTGATCGTGTVTLSGTLLPTVGSPFVVNADSMKMRTNTGQSLCIVSAGTGPSIQGVLVVTQGAF